MDQKTHILSVLPLTPAQKDRLLASAGSQFTVTFTASDRVTDEELRSARIILGNVDPGKLKKAENLQWLQLNSAGSDPYEAPGVLHANALLTNAVGAYGQTVSEHMAASLFTMIKRLHQYRDNQNRSLWQDEGPVGSISGNQVLIVGFGSIGASLGKTLHALGNQITAIRRNASTQPGWVQAVHTLEDLDRLLPAMDVVALCLPSNAATAGLFQKNRFAAMKPGSFFLNGGRGNLVNTDDLLWALQEGPLAGAALDVTDPEPLPENHPLWKEANALITPHVSGGFHMDVTLERIVDICCHNLRQFQKSLPLRNLVTSPVTARSASEKL